MFTFPYTRRHMLTAVCVYVLSLFALTPLASAQQRSIDDRLDALLTPSDLSNAFWGVHVVNTRTGKAIYSRNASHSFIPASNLKLFTTAAALVRLGPDFRYVTDLFARGTIRDSVLIGDLIVRGSGDPSIGGRFTGGDRTWLFRSWADSLEAHGIQHITGDIIGDDNIFDDKGRAISWTWNDLKYWYAAPTSGLSYNDNCIDVFIYGSEPGKPANVSWRPNTNYIMFENATRTISSVLELDEGYKHPLGTRRIRLTSLVPADGVDRESLAVYNPTRYFVYVLRETLIQSGISVEGQAIDIDARTEPVIYHNSSVRRIARHKSPPLHVIVQITNKKSQNLYADQLVKTIGVYAADTVGKGSFEAGTKAVEAFMGSIGIDTTRIQMVDGSGLSRKNLVTPRAITTLLQTLRKHPDKKVRSAFYQSLPIGGIDGTLEYRFPYEPARGNVRAKTGYLSNVRSLSGYVTTQDGTLLAFSILCNHYTVDTDRVDHLQNVFVSHLANLSLQ